MTDGAPPVEAATPLRPYSGVEYVFTPHTSSLPPVRAYLQEVWGRRNFVVAMAKADVRGARSRTVLGEFWALLDPIFMAAIYWFVITMIRGGTGGMDANERLTILVSGIFLFTFTAQSMSGGGRSIISNKGLMLNSTFPRVLLPLTVVYKGLMNLGPMLAIYVLVHLFLGGPIGVGIFVLPLLILLQVCITTGLALIFATVTVFIRDMANVLDYIQRVLFFATPILYPVSMLSDSLRSVLAVNPLFALFSSYQAIVTGGVPGIGLVLQAAAWALVLLVVGFRLFVANERGFALRL